VHDGGFGLRHERMFACAADALNEALRRTASAKGVDAELRAPISASASERPAVMLHSNSKAGRLR
jgi:hypothetical protein